MLMESTDEGLQGHRSAATNWIVIGGSLANCVAIESSDTPTDLQNNIVSSKSPLILRPASSDSSPCEITINFTKRHEVRQVYVRSTARVYEIYVTPKVQGDNEYLCTVRCGIAAKEEVSDVALCNKDGSLCLGECKHSNDEEWVEVKVPKASEARNGASAASVNPCTDMDLYEATAEICDSDPCISLTLRLLSIQSQGCVYVDEVYVFADPVDIESDMQEDKAGYNAEGSALAMLIPSILQICRAKGGNVEQDKHNFGLRDKCISPASKAENMERERLLEEVNETPATARNSEEEMKHHLTNDKQIGFSTVVEQPRQNSQHSDNGRSNHDAPSGRVETLLEQLISRVSRMEALYLRFEESMLRPINNIEARLQQVELKIESLVERQLNDEERHCKRFSAPEYSLSESNANSMYGNETENYKCGESDQHLHKSKSSDKCTDLHDGDDNLLENTPHFIPCLTVTAPEFSQCDEDENYLLVASASSSMSDSAKEKPRPVSIDDALATALAGFMSSVPVRHTQSLVVKAPDFSNEEDEDIEESASPEMKLSVPANSSSLCIDEMKFTKDSLVSSLKSKVDNANVSDCITVEKSNTDQHNEKEILQETKGIGEAVSGEAVIECSQCPLIIAQSTENEEFSSSLSCGDTEEVSNELLEIHAPNPVLAKEDSQGNILQDLLLAYSVGSASVVDFKSPILDVTFLPQDNGSVSSTTTLEVLLSDETETSFSERIYETCSVVEQHRFIELDDDREALDTAYCDLPELAIKQDDEKPDEEQLSAGSLI